MGGCEAFRGAAYRSCKAVGVAMCGKTVRWRRGTPGATLESAESRCLSGCKKPQARRAMGTLREKLWLFGMPVVERHRQRQENRGPQGHLMTALEAGVYLGIPNALYVVQQNFPEPPFESYARALVGFSKVVWSILGDRSSDRNDLGEVLRMAKEFPNITGALMDDFFKHPKAEGPLARFSLEQTEEFADRLHEGPRQIDLWVVLYAHQLGLDTDEHLKRCDVVTFWNWWGREIDELEASFRRVEARAGDKPKMLGCYFQDYGSAGDGGDVTLSLERMKRQCETGLEWLKVGRLQGMILLGNPICGLGLETVEWAREWIREVGDQPI